MLDKSVFALRRLSANQRVKSVMISTIIDSNTLIAHLLNLYLSIKNGL